MQYLLDTNIYGLSLLDSINKQKIHPNIHKFLGENDVNVISRFVYSELLTLKTGFSLKNIRNDRLDLLIRKIRTEQLIVEFGEITTLILAQLKSELLHTYNQRNRTVDLYIAAQCIENNLTLVTANRKDFENVKGLKILNYDQANYKFS